MTTFILRLTSLAIATLSFTIPSFAHKKIDAIINELTGGNGKVEVIYSEQRDPSTHRVTSSSHVITSSDKALFKKVYDAIQAERQNSSSYSQVGSEVISITFIDGGNTYSYSLISDEDDSEWMLSASTQPGRTKGSTVCNVKNKRRTARKPDHNAADSEI